MSHDVPTRCVCLSMPQIPRVLWEHTSARVLTMEFEEGACATDVKALQALVRHDSSAYLHDLLLMYLSVIPGSFPDLT